MNTIHVVIPAGGAGTRLWPLSRRSRPKFLLDLLGSGQSLLQQTVLRLRPIAQTLTVVTGRAHVVEVRQQIEQLDLAVPVRVLAEPSPKDSMAAIGLAACLIGQEFGDEAVVGSFAADHVIRERCAFLQTICTSVQAVERGFLTTIGLTPDFASTAYGYIQTGRALQPSTGLSTPAQSSINLSASSLLPTNLSTPLQPLASSSASTADTCADTATEDLLLFEVKKFVEKPTLTLAQDYVAQGFLWNAGMFVFQAGLLAELVRAFLPAMDKGLQLIARASKSPGFGGQLEKVWPTLPKIAIDNALAEPAANSGQVAVAVAPPLGWNDVGDFVALSQLANNADTVVRVDSNGGYVYSSKDPRQKTIAVLGLDNVVVVDTADALLVTTTEHAQKVKQVVDKLRAQGLDELL